MASDITGPMAVPVFRQMADKVFDKNKGCTGTGSFYTEQGYQIGGEFQINPGIRKRSGTDSLLRDRTDGNLNMHFFRRKGSL